VNKQEALGPEGKRLLTTQKGLLTTIEQQQAFILKQAMLAPPCAWPDCKKPVSEIVAADNSWTVENGCSDSAHHCPHCGRPLQFILPLMGGSWFWLPGTEGGKP
jgi:hypothetical protein